MKYYKLVNNLEGECYPKGILGRIYPENDSFKSHNSCVSSFNKDHPEMFQKVTPGEYFVQEGIMPEYFAIKRVEGNPLWEKYIDWLQKTYPTSYTGSISNQYYGYDNNSISGCNCYACFSSFENNPIELTLEQWDQIINKNMEEEFVLPENWHINVTEDNINFIKQWWNTAFYGTSHIVGMVKWCEKTCSKGYNPKGIIKGSNYDYGKEISTQQFIKYVLKQEIMEENKEFIGWKLKDLKYQKASQAITDLSWPYNNILTTKAFQSSISSLKTAGVLELWFEPVYKPQCPQITINNQKGEFFDDYVKFGCAQIHKVIFIELNDLNIQIHNEDTSVGTKTNREISTVTIGSGTFTKDQIKQIAEYYINKK